MPLKAEALCLFLAWKNTQTGEQHEHVEPLPVMIGRAASMNTIVLDHKQVSRQHAWLENVGGKVVLIDQDSTNGTYIDDCRIRCATLKDGDCFQIGPFIFTAATRLAA